MRNTCPRRFIHKHPNKFEAIIDAYRHYKEGYLPHGGGIHDQHCNFAPLMRVVDSTVNILDKRKRDAEESKNKGLAKQGAQSPKRR